MCPGFWVHITKGVFLSFHNIPNHHRHAGQNHKGDNEDSAIAEKGFGEDQDDGIGFVVKKPVDLTGEKDLVEHHKGTVKVNGRQNRRKT